MDSSQDIKNRYSQVERETDSLGRVIGVKRLKVSQQIKISEMTPQLEGEAEMTTQDGRVIRIARRSIPLAAAAVCEIDGDLIPFARNRGELDSIMDRLDDEGLMAAVIAFGKLVPSTKTSDDTEVKKTEEGPFDVAKK